MDTILKVALVGFSLSMAFIGAASAQYAPASRLFGPYPEKGLAAYPSHEGRTVALENSRHDLGGQVHRRHPRTGELR